MGLNRKLNLKLKDDMDSITKWIVNGKRVELTFINDDVARQVWNKLRNSKLFKTSMTINRVLFVSEVK